MKVIAVQSSGDQTSVSIINNEAILTGPAELVTMGILKFKWIKKTL